MIGDVISGAIAAVIGNYMTSCFVLGLIVAAAQVWRFKGRRTASVVSGLFVNAYLLYAVGVGMIINFVMHSVFGDFAAKTIGWAQSPFQFELALMSLGLGLIAIIVHTRTGQFRAKTAVVVASVVMGLGAAGGHVYQLVVNGDTSVNNTGLLLVDDVLINLVGLAFVVWHGIARRHDEVHLTDEPVRQAERIG